MKDSQIILQWFKDRIKKVNINYIYLGVIILLTMFTYKSISIYLEQSQQGNQVKKDRLLELKEKYNLNQEKIKENTKEAKYYLNETKIKVNNIKIYKEKQNEIKKEIKEKFEIKTHTKDNIIVHTKKTTKEKIKNVLKTNIPDIINKITWDKDDPKQELVDYAYMLGGKDFVTTIDCESYTWTINRQSIAKGFDGNRAYGICQLYYTYHKDFINSKEFNNPYRQIEYCYEVWNNAISKGRLKTTFYAYNVRHKCEKHFNF